MRKTIYWTGLVGAVGFILIALWGGMRLEEFNPVQQFISESYATGIAGAAKLRYGFMASGLLLAFFCFASPFVLPKSKLLKIAFWGVGFFYGIGTIITSIFPCDLGCATTAETASTSQIIHNISGALTYMFTPFCMILIGIKAIQWKNTKNTALITLICGVTAACFVLLLFASPTSEYKGLYQRIIEGSILFWLIYFAFVIKKIV